jgi:hypothetical protein
MAKRHQSRGRRVVRRPNEVTPPEDREDLLEPTLAQEDNLVKIYQTFANQKLIRLCDLQEQRIYAYP